MLKLTYAQLIALISTHYVKPFVDVTYDSTKGRTQGSFSTGVYFDIGVDRVEIFQIGRFYCPEGATTAKRVGHADSQRVDPNVATWFLDVEAMSYWKAAEISDAGVKSKYGEKHSEYFARNKFVIKGLDLIQDNPRIYNRLQSNHACRMEWSEVDQDHLYSVVFAKATKLRDAVELWLDK